MGKLLTLYPNISENTTISCAFYCSMPPTILFLQRH